MSSKYPLMEEDGFVLRSQPGEYWVSWIDHRDCPSHQAPISATAPWRWVNIYDGHCTYCPRLVPEGILGAWKLHNYDNHAKALRIRSSMKSYVK